MTALAAALGVIVTWLLGMAFASLLEPFDRATRIGFAYGLGLVWVSVVLGAIALLGVPLTPAVAIPFTVLPVAVWWLFRQRQRAPRANHDTPDHTFSADGLLKRGDPWWWGAAVLLGAVGALVMVRVLIKPIRAWDAWAVYARKAKTIYFEAGIPRSMFESVGVPNYPLGLPLQEVWIAWFAGSWDDIAVKLLFPGYLLALCLIVYGTVREWLGPRAGMVGALFVAALPLMLQHAQEAYTDLPLAYFVLAGAVALACYGRSGSRSALVLASVFGVGAIWMREDGVLVVAANAAVLGAVLAWAGRLSTRSGRADLALFLAPGVTVWLVWALVKIRLGISSNLVMDADAWTMFVTRLPTVMEALVQCLFLDGNWLILWALFFPAILFEFGATVRRDWVFLVWPMMLYLVAVVALALATPMFDYLRDKTVLSRLVLHVAPLGALWVVLAYGRSFCLVARYVREKHGG